LVEVPLNYIIFVKNRRKRDSFNIQMSHIEIMF